MGTVPTMIRSFKSAVTKCINEISNIPGAPVWQRNYHEHVIRNEDDYTGIAEYIANNPQRWTENSLHPDAIHSVNIPNHSVGARRNKARQSTMQQAACGIGTAVPNVAHKFRNESEP